ncbi:hypothetical protein AVEN_168440-1 [Araneus ventricosus]|uniref:Uncharacterized protein n=1 Tax=Araneus ventricosus TaxID=182803 RepID=A0A4Y2GRA1_ARAVE|nr:hypothetical protein AVEN_168440-1 [Araneus ventricosus]
MEADQTGFSGSPPNSVAGVSAAASTCSDDANNGDSTPPNPGGVNRCHDDPVIRINGVCPASECLAVMGRFQCPV